MNTPLATNTQFSMHGVTGRMLFRETVVGCTVSLPHPADVYCTHAGCVVYKQARTGLTQELELQPWLHASFLYTHC